MKQKIFIKPLSINKAFQGRRFKTKLYKSYENELIPKIKKIKIKEGAKLELDIKFGFSSKLADIDNPLKPLIDILQKSLNFNDKLIYKMTVEKLDVKKGSEFIEFTISYI